MNEDVLERACLDWLSGLGYTCLHGDEVRDALNNSLGDRS